MVMSTLLSIPLMDRRENGPVHHVLEEPARARALRDDCLAWLPAATRLLLPALDVLTRQWLRRSSSPYVPELETIAAALGFSGVWFLNGTYQWGCTALARDEEGVPWLVRTLDWPFSGLGRHLEVVHMRGPAGEFFNVSWPGYAGVLTATAPGRFAAAINQAPLRRRTERPWLRPYDIAANLAGSWRLRSYPPDHLLREVFETCAEYAEAKHRLETASLARPVIFTLIGCQSGERCVIERTEEDHRTHLDHTAAANDWRESRRPWEARIASDLFLRCSYEEAIARSRARCAAISSWSRPLADGDFGWVAPPVLNPCTRSAIEMCPALGILNVLGFEPEPGSELPHPVNRFSLSYLAQRSRGGVPPEARVAQEKSAKPSSGGVTLYPSG
jgi:hypothetical protein